MAKSKPKRPQPPKPKADYGRPSPDVANFVAVLAHPRKTELLAVRDLILSASSEIQEGIKWNAPSFWRGAWFATFHLRAKPGLMVVLHQGAKLKSTPSGKFVDDPGGLLSWITNDRCTFCIADAEDLKRKAKGLKAIISDWSQRVALASKSAEQASA